MNCHGGRESIATPIPTPTPMGQKQFSSRLGSVLRMTRRVGEGYGRGKVRLDVDIRQRRPHAVPNALTGKGDTAIVET